MPGTAVTALLAKPGGAPITLVSVYGLIQRRANGVGYAVPSVHGVLNDLTATLDVGRSKKAVLVAGDLNLVARGQYARNFLIFELVTVAAIWYLFFTTVFSLLQAELEARLRPEQERSGFFAALGRALSFRGTLPDPGGRR